MTNTYIGMIDILGYSNMEKASSMHGDFFIKQVFSRLDKIAGVSFIDSVEFHRYGDGYVFKTLSISDAVTSVSKLIALALSSNIPLRAIITTGELSISHSTQSGLTVSGAGWDNLRKYEGSLDWMGGLLYLPQHDGTTHDEVLSLLSNLHIIKPEVRSSFPNPIKDGVTLIRDKYWYLNWQRPLKLHPENISQLVNSWWSGYPPNAEGEGKNLIAKKENTIDFGNYCVSLSDSIQALCLAGVIPSSYCNAIN